MTCPKKIVLWVPHAAPMVGTFGIATCAEEEPHEDHTGTIGEYGPGDGRSPSTLRMVFPTTVTWMTVDRRCYEGDLVLCTETAGCVCPADHRGRCAT